MRRLLIWAGLALSVLVPLALASQSPLLAWRQPIYIIAGFAGIAAMGFLPAQIALTQDWAGGVRQSRLLHRWLGPALLVLVLIHVAGLWVTSPPDVVDALLFRSPTPFSVWGVAAMWALIAAAVLARFRRHLRFRTWRRGHVALAGVLVLGTVVHVILIEGTMERLSKLALSAVLLFGFGKVVLDVFQMRKGRGNPRPRA